MKVEVAYALPQQQCIIALEVEPGCTALTAAQRSGIDQQFPEIDWQNAVLGIFGKLLDAPALYTLSEGERVEIYRPLLIDPKAVRKQRAAKAKR
jgi:putative ubiquitin-RnfH superfamily antitoxin RatB of RatAB toxin-antitoxin module